MPAPVLPFTIVIDSNESAPYSFVGINSDSNQGRDGEPWIVPVTRKALWSMHRVDVEVDGMPFTKGLADYSIEGMEERMQIERKSLSDLYSTLGQKRKEFEAEVSRLCHCEFAAVVIEADWNQILFDPPPNSRLNPKTVGRTILSWSVRYPRVHWFLCNGRRHGELTTFQLLRQFWRNSK